MKLEPISKIAFVTKNLLFERGEVKDGEEYREYFEAFLTSRSRKEDFAVEMDS